MGFFHMLTQGPNLFPSCWFRVLQDFRVHSQWCGKRVEKVPPLPESPGLDVIYGIPAYSTLVTIGHMPPPPRDQEGASSVTNWELLSRLTVHTVGGGAPAFGEQCAFSALVGLDECRFGVIWMPEGQSSLQPGRSVTHNAQGLTH